MGKVDDGGDDDADHQPDQHQLGDDVKRGRDAPAFIAACGTVGHHHQQGHAGQRQNVALMQMKGLETQQVRHYPREHDNDEVEYREDDLGRVALGKDHVTRLARLPFIHTYTLSTRP